MKIKFFFTGLAFLFILALALMTGNGGDAGKAWANSGSEADEILDAMPDDYPENFSDSDIDELMKDIEDVDESADAEQKKDIEPLTPDERAKALADEIRRHPELYRELLQNEQWLALHEAAMWLILSDFAWVAAHPKIIIPVYMNYRYWQAHPRIAYVIVRNRPFLYAYPRVCVSIYTYDTWFLARPWIAREIYLHHAFFIRHPRHANRYYRHRDWIHRHPAVARAAYGSRDFYRKHPAYLRDAYHYRRVAVRNRHVPEQRVRAMYERRDHYRTWHRTTRERGAVRDTRGSGRTYDRDRDRRSDQPKSREPNTSDKRVKDSSRDRDKSGPAYRDRHEKGRTDLGHSGRNRDDGSSGRGDKKDRERGRR